MSQRRATSQIEKHFQTHTIYKRSKNIIDIEHIKSIEKLQEINRRKPTNSKDTLDTRVGSSFINYQEVYEEKRINDIDKCRKTNSDIWNPQQTKQTFQPQVKVPIMRKMLSRAQNDKSKSPKNNNYESQERFNNFSITQYNPKISIQFSKSPKNSRYQESLDETGINQEKRNSAYIRNNFNSAAFKCLIDLKKRALQKPNKPLILSPLNIKNIQRGINLTSSYRGNNISSFYSSISTDKPHQMDMKTRKPNQLYYTINPIDIQDFSVIKRKQEMRQKRLKEILQRKIVKDNKEEMCEVKYFRRMESKR